MLKVGHQLKFTVFRRTAVKFERARVGNTTTPPLAAYRDDGFIFYWQL